MVLRRLCNGYTDAAGAAIGISGDNPLAKTATTSTLLARGRQRDPQITTRQSPYRGYGMNFGT